ncbi:LysR substrate-binding domain-containing protein [Mesorhizobium abyssinicae]
MPPLNSLRAFDAAAKYESISRAAEELSVTHTAVSRQVRNLEEWFGTELFHREGRGIRLTHTGQLLRERTRRVFNELSEVGRSFRQRERAGTIIISSLPSIATHWIAPNIGIFTDLHPTIQVQIQYSKLEDQFAYGNFDVLISDHRQEAKGVVSEPLFSRRCQPVCSREYLSANPHLSAPEALLTAKLLHDEHKEGWREWFRKNGHIVHGDIPGNIFQDFSLLYAAVASGQGVALCPVEAFRSQLEIGQLVSLSGIEVHQDKYYSLVRSENPRLIVKQFADWFLARCRGTT